MERRKEPQEISAFAEQSPFIRALQRRESGDLGGAIDILYQAVGDAMTSPLLVITLAKMLSENGDFARAEHWFRHALKLAPDDADLHFGYGTFLAERERYPEAREWLERARAGHDNGTAFEGAVATNLARVHLELGDPTTALELIGRWLSDEDAWGGAHDLFADIAERLDLDTVKASEEGLASGRISPLMVCHLLEYLLSREPVELAELERVVARADQIFEFAWRRGTPELEEALARCRKFYLEAIMRGEVDVDPYPHILMSSVGEDLAADPDDLDERVEDGERDSDEAPPFESIVRIVALADDGPLREVSFGRFGAHWYANSVGGLQSIDEASARRIVTFVAQTLAGFAPRRAIAPMPMHGRWLVQGFGVTKVVGLDHIADDERAFAATAFALLQLRAALLGTWQILETPFRVLLVVGPELVPGTTPVVREVEAYWTSEGFLYRERRAPDDEPEVAAWLEGATPRLTDLVPSLGDSMPAIVHPVAAWELLAAAHAEFHADTGPFAPSWVRVCDLAIRGNEIVDDTDGHVWMTDS